MPLAYSKIQATSITNISTIFSCVMYCSARSFARKVIYESFSQDECATTCLSCVR